MRRSRRSRPSINDGRGFRNSSRTPRQRRADRMRSGRCRPRQAWGDDNAATLAIRDAVARATSDCFERQATLARPAVPTPRDAALAVAGSPPNLARCSNAASIRLPLGPVLYLYAFRFFDDVSVQWIRARSRARRSDREHGAFKFRATIFAAIRSRLLPKSSRYPQAAFRIQMSTSRH